MSKPVTELVELFNERLKELSVEIVVPSPSLSLNDYLRQFVMAEDFTSVVLGRGAPDGLAAALEGATEVLADYSNGGAGGSEAAKICAKAKAGITGIDAIIADTGTLVIASKTAGDRATSLIPPVHIAILEGVRAYETLADYLVAADPTLTHQFITGPSRTADIEKKLVLGVHGPVRVIVVE